MPNLGSWEFHLKEFYEESIQDNLDYIKFIHSENKILQEIRESHPKEWKIIELCREIIFENKKKLSLILKEMDYDRSKIKEFDGILRRRQSNLIPGDEPEVNGTT